MVVWTIQAFYLRTSRQVRLLDLEAKAPLYAQFLETTEGLTTIRALHWQQGFADQNAELLDKSQNILHYVLHSAVAAGCFGPPHGRACDRSGYIGYFCEQED